MSVQVSPEARKRGVEKAKATRLRTKSAREKADAKTK